MRSSYRSIAARQVVVGAFLTVAFGVAGAAAQSRTCDDGRGGIMTDLGFGVDPRPAWDGAEPGVAAPRFLSEPTVTQLRKDGPAAGRLQEADVLLAIDGYPITSAEAARRYAELRPGDRISLTVRRGEERLEVTIVAMGRCVPHPPAPADAPPPPAPPTVDAPPTPPGDELMPEGGLGFTIRCDDCADDPATGVLRFNTPPIVSSVKRGSLAARLGIRPGDRLTHMDGESLTSPAGWARFSAIQPGEAVRFRFTQDGREKEITITAGEPTSGALMAPAVDHHKHLFSPAAAELGSEQPRPSVPLPAELEGLLDDRERHWGDAADLAALYTGNSIAFDAAWPAWWQGASAVATHMTRRFGKPYELTPIAYELGAGGGYITGYYSRDELGTTHHFGHFVLTVVKDTAGRWRIAAEAPSFPGPDRLEPIPTKDPISDLDAAGVRRAVVLSVAYWFGSPRNEAPVENEYAKVRAENDWVAEQVARYPDRLTAFCSFNPLREYALDELDRCHRDLHMTGLKLHFGNSVVDVRNPEHVEKVRRVFEAANDRRMTLVVHLWTDPAYEKEGAEHATAFLEKILPGAADVTVQIAHMAGGGRSTEPALRVFANAIAAGDPRTRNVYFDVATLTSGQTDEGLQRDAVRMRQIGFDRILWGSDAGSTQKLWREFRVLMPLTLAELRSIATNVAPYVR